jgi:hypothetical protein
VLVYLLESLAELEVLGCAELLLQQRLECSWLSPHYLITDYLE